MKTVLLRHCAHVCSCSADARTVYGDSVSYDPSFFELRQPIEGVCWNGARMFNGLANVRELPTME